MTMLWGGRFEKSPSNAMEDFHSSIAFDSRLYREDIFGSIAHATMLGEQGIITMEDAQAIIEGLQGILTDIEQGHIEFTKTAEDIHMNIETILIERIGQTGKRLHTGRSRNDQVALDTRMYAKNAIDRVISELVHLEDVLLNRSEENLEVIMPGYTHMQKAQPITLAHHMMAYFTMFQRDIERFGNVKERTDVMPLGAGALAGTTYPLNRERVAALLGFTKISTNSLDAVSDRDYLIEFCAAASIVMMHLSRFCEEIILWASHEWRFVTLDDAYSTGSSIMPQKKNPDAAELIRGKTGRVYGDLTALLSLMKSLPLAYNKDMQEDKEAFFDAYDTLIACLGIFTAMLETTRFHPEAMLLSAGGGFTNATDAADYLVSKGIPFRQAHEVIGKLVLYCEHHRLTLDDLTLAQYREFSPMFEADIFEAIDLHTCVAQRKTYGGPAPDQVQQQIQAGRDYIGKLKLT